METQQGTPGNDNLVGTSDGEEINAGLGDDTITGALGDDTLIGGDGSDQFVFNNIIRNFGVSIVYVYSTDGFDVINDFDSNGGDRVYGIDAQTQNSVHQSFSGNSPNEILKLDRNSNDERIRVQTEDGADIPDNSSSYSSIIADIDSDIVERIEGFEQAREELEQAREELEQTRKELEQTREELENEIDAIQQELNEATDRSYILGDNLETLSFTGSNNINSVGNLLDNEIDGNAGENFFIGGDGSDRLNGYENDDILVGELGSDTLNGGSGNDILIGGVGDDIFTGGPGADTFVIDSELDLITDFNPQEGDKIEISTSQLGTDLFDGITDLNPQEGDTIEISASEFGIDLNEDLFSFQGTINELLNEQNEILSNISFSLFESSELVGDLDTSFEISAL